MSSQTLLLPVGLNGLELTAPDSVRLLAAAATVEPGAATGCAEQQALVSAALKPLVELAKSRRRVALVVGGLAHPAPYPVALPAVAQALVSAGIRPARVTLISAPDSVGPVLGRAAIQRYGEELIGDYDFHAWWVESGNVDPLYAAADLKLVVTPRLAAIAPLLPPDLPPDVVLELQLGHKLQIDIIAARCRERLSPPGVIAPPQPQGDYDVALTSGGGWEWDTTLEEALLSVEYQRPRAGSTLVLAFSGHEGLGSAYFVGNLRALLREADEMLAQSGTLSQLPRDASQYDPLLTLADALSRWARVVLFSGPFCEHEEGDELRQELSQLPQLSQRLLLCSDAAQLWQLLAGLHAPGYALHFDPLGWRAAAFF